MRLNKVILAMAAAFVLVPALVAQGANGNANYHAVCPGPPDGYAHCHVLVVSDSHGNPLATGAPTGLAPATIQSVYGFPTGSSAGTGETIALVDAYDDPTIANDLSVFSSQYGLPSCGSGCFQKVNQTGGTTYPQANGGWSLEIALDVEWAHAVAPGAKILLVEATSNSFANLMAAEDYAKAHAQYVSNSWGGSEFSGENFYDPNFVQSGVSFFVSAGDSGLPAEYPSTSPDVVSVGGTTLHFDGSGTFTGETGWSDGGGGCSSYESATSAQSSFSQYSQVGCGGRRATPDVALDADPSSGVSVYDTTSYSGQTGWFQVGGTSASSPMWAARSADAGVVVNAAYVYGNNIGFRDITSGNNGASCLVGFDLCSGRGSWAGGSQQSQGSLSFSTASQTLTAGQPSGQITVALSPAPQAPVSISLSTSSSGGGFSTSATGPFSSTLTLPPTSSNASFYYEDTRAGAPTLTASASGYTGSTQSETVQAGTLTTISVSPASATVAEGGSKAFSAAGADQYGNPVSVASATWTTTAPGSVSPTTGASTTFTASSTQTGGGSVTATIGSVENGGSVTVTALQAPSNLVAASQGKHVGLAWQSAGAGVTYDLYRGTASGSEILYATGLTGTSANDFNVSGGVTYYYFVTAVAGGAQSGPSNEARVTAK